MGISNYHEADAKFIRIIGSPFITGMGDNAFGSVKALYSDGSALPFNCSHGGSMYLCLSCAKQLILKEDERREKDGAHKSKGEYV